MKDSKFRRIDENKSERERHYKRDKQQKEATLTEEIINNTIAINQEYGVDLLPYKCEKVSKRTMPHIILSGPDQGKTILPDGTIVSE
jgi:hypothetical protein